jgi:excisionase family DNA binding protein
MRKKNETEDISSLNSQESGSPKYDQLLTVKEAARFLRIQPSSLYHLISQRRLPVVRISSRCVRFKLSALREWIEGLSQPAE